VNEKLNESDLVGNNFLVALIEVQPELTQAKKASGKSRRDPRGSTTSFRMFYFLTLLFRK
jgi:hypothetical protein